MSFLRTDCAVELSPDKIVERGAGEEVCRIYSSYNRIKYRWPQGLSRSMPIQQYDPYEHPCKVTKIVQSWIFLLASATFQSPRTPMDTSSKQPSFFRNVDITLGTTPYRPAYLRDADISCSRSESVLFVDYMFFGALCLLKLRCSYRKYRKPVRICCGRAYIMYSDCDYVGWRRADGVSYKSCPQTWCRVQLSDVNEEWNLPQARRIFFQIIFSFSSTEKQ